jgi:hypothetical protein
MTLRLLAVLLLLPALAFAQVAPRTPLLIEGKQSLFQRVIARPGATLSPRPDGQGAHPVPGFTVYYVYARPPGGGDAARIEVGRTADGRPEGWLEGAKAIEWKHAMVAAFTNPAGRQPVLFLRSERDERLLMMDSQAGQRARDLRATAAAAGADPGPVIAVEPAAVVDFSRNFYLMPILSAERIEREFGPPLRLLEVISAPAEPRRPPGPPAAPAQFKAGVVFVLDTTISMQPYIDRTREAIRGIVASIGSTPLRDNFRFGLVAYRDSLEDSPGLEYSTKVYGKPDFSQPADSINTGVATAKEATASSTGFDEDPIGGIKAALDEIDWSPMAGRFIVLITDAGARRAQHPHSLTHLDIAEIRELAKAKGVAVFAIHLLTPEGRARHDHEPAAAQYQELTQFGAAGPLYFPVPNGAPDAFARTVQDLTRALLSQVGEAAGRPVAAGPVPAPAIEAAARVVGEAMRLTYVGRAESTQAPDVVRSWTTDRDLADPAVPSLDVRVLLTRNQLSDLARSLQTILQAGLAGRTEPRTFFTQLRATFAAAARDPQRIAGAQRIGALLGEYLDGLPYQSEIMDIQEADWIAMGAIAQRTVLNSIEAKLRLYQEFQSNADLWVDLSGSRAAGEALFPVPIEALP